QPGRGAGGPAAGRFRGREITRRTIAPTETSGGCLTRAPGGGRELAPVPARPRLSLLRWAWVAGLLLRLGGDLGRARGEEVLRRRAGAGRRDRSGIYRRPGARAGGWRAGGGAGGGGGGRWGARGRG